MTGVVVEYFCMAMFTAPSSFASLRSNAHSPPIVIPAQAGNHLSLSAKFAS
jgi:hypothetical protein